MRGLRTTAAAAASVLSALLVGLAAGPAHADDASIAHVESNGDGLRILVTVPTDVTVDLDGVTATVDDSDLDATAEPAGAETLVQRTAVLAIDTSSSMAKRGRFDAAKAAADAYLEAVPADVQVGIVTFDDTVETALEPTTDREAAHEVVAGLALHRETLLYDGMSAAIDLAGDEGQRSVLLLSDGADTGTTTTLDDVAAAITEAAVLVDVVSLGQTGDDLAAVQTLAEAGRGTVVEASGPSLTATFEEEAEALAHQVLVTAPLPEGFDSEEATVEVVLPSDGGELVASAFVLIQEGAAEQPAGSGEPELGGPGWAAPGWLLYVGVGVFGVGLLAAAVLLVPRPSAPMTIAERVTAYAGPSGSPAQSHKQTSDPVLGQAKAAAAGVLHRNRDLEEKMAARLIAAGSGWKPSEWLLLQVAIVVGAVLLGLLLGRGNPVLALLFLPVGLIAPRVYLAFKTTRRRRAFNSNLPDTLQLMAGSLAAGLSLAQSVDTVVTEGPEPIASEFKRVLVETRIGLPLEDAFDGVAERFDSEDFAWVVMAIRIQRQVGGNLAELLTTVAATMREREYLRRQVAALAAEGKLSAIILSVLPPGFLVFLQFSNPTYTKPLFNEPLGIVMITGGALWLALGVFWMSRLVKVEI